MCGATDCPSCGPAQGYAVEYVPGKGHCNVFYCERCEERFLEEDEIDENGHCEECAAEEEE